MGDYQKRPLYKRAKRLMENMEAKRHTLTEIDLGVFEAIGRAEWDKDRIHWAVLSAFERMYVEYFPSRKK